MKEDYMTHLRSLAACTIGLALLTQAVDGQGLGRYRNFELGMNVGAVTALTGTATADVRAIHQRPAGPAGTVVEGVAMGAGIHRHPHGPGRTDRLQLLQRSPVPGRRRLRAQPHRRDDGPGPDRRRRRGIRSAPQASGGTDPGGLAGRGRIRGGGGAMAGRRRDCGIVPNRVYPRGLPADCNEAVARQSRAESHDPGATAR